MMQKINIIFSASILRHARLVRGAGCPRKAGMTKRAFRNHTKNPENSGVAGNILIYILGAVILIGFLVIALRGNFQEGTGITGERNALAATQVQRYASELERGVAYILRNGFSEADLRFAHPNADAAYGDINDNPPRQIFSSEGGGVEWRNPPRGIQTTVTPWHFTVRNRVASAAPSVTYAGTRDTPDLVAILPNVTKDFCITVNNQLDFPNPGGSPFMDADWIATDTPFDGTIPTAMGPMLQTPPDHADIYSGCVGATTAGGGHAAGTYHYYRVLLAR